MRFREANTLAFCIALTLTNSYTRHPSYLGFFTWALGTQIGLSNPLSTIIFAVVLWRFFSRRIRGEEIYLVAFFGREYEEYRKRVGVYIPFVR